MQRPPPPSGPPSRPPPPRPPSRPSPKSTVVPPKSPAHQRSSSSSSAPEFFSESQLPSCKSGFYKPSEERTMRRRTCRFLEEASRKLQLPRMAISTSMVFFHRFYAVHSFEDHDRFEVAVACILLAAKTEESPKKLVNVIQECYRLKNLSARRAAATGGSSPNLNDDGKTRVNKHGYLDIKCEEFIRLKERILLLERVILHTIGFELSIDHPYKELVEQIQKLVRVPVKQIEYISTNTAQPQDPNKMKNDLVQYAMNFANDSMHTSLCLQFPPKTIAHTCVYMSGQYCKMRPTEGRKWFDILEVEMEDLASIAIQVMELIADKKGIDKSLYAPIQADLEIMKKTMGGAPPSRPPGDRPRPPPMGGREAKRPRL